MKETKYNYIFYNIFDDYFKPIFGSLSNFPFVKIFGRAFDANPVIEKLFFLHWSAKINKIIKLPFKKIWYKKMCCHKFEDDKPTCYVFLGGKYITQEPELFKYIKKLNPQNKCVVLYLDIASKSNIKIEEVKNVSDKIISYDANDASKLGIEYLDMNYYTPLIGVTTPETFENDVYFLGFAKDRLDEIHNTYNYLVKNNVKCNFIICGTEPQDRISGEGLHYRSPISYIENLNNVNSSKCVLEIIQGQSVAPTLRLREACTYKRKLITNNSNPEYLKSIHSDNICVFNDPLEIDIDFIKSNIKYEKFSNEYSSPIKLIEHLDETL